MAKTKTKTATSRGQAAAKASAATTKSSVTTKPAATSKTASSNLSKNKLTGAESKARPKSAGAAPASSDIRQAYKKSLLGKYLGEHRGQPAIKPIKKR